MDCRVMGSVGMALLLLLSLGCGEGNPLNRQAISGDVTVNGQPLAQGTIAFVPPRGGTVRSGGMISAGHYKLSVDQGLPPGEYAVNISAPDTNAPAQKAPDGIPVAPPELIPPDYSRDGAHKISVTEGGANVFDFAIETKKAPAKP